MKSGNVHTQETTIMMYVQHVQEKDKEIGEEICGPENVGKTMEFKDDGKLISLQTMSGTNVWSARIRGFNMGSDHTAITMGW